MLALQQRPEVRRAARSRDRPTTPSSWPPATTRASSATTDGRFHLQRGADNSKDQTYFLFSLTQEQLARARVSGRPSRQGHRARARAAAEPARRREAGQPGDLLRARRRLRRVRRARGAGRWRAPAPSSTTTAACSARTPACTASRSASARASACRPPSRSTCWRSSRTSAQVVVGPRDALGRTTLTASEVNWISGAAPTDWLRVSAQIRHRHAAAPAQVRAATDDGARRTRVRRAPDRDHAGPGRGVLRRRRSAGRRLDRLT